MADLPVTVRLLTEADLEAADRVLQASFGRAASFQPELATCLGLQPDCWLAAEGSGSSLGLVGLVGAVDFGAFARLGLMAVHPSVQRQGIGQALLTALLARLEQRGCPVALLDATAAGLPLYRRFGFAEEGQSEAWARPELARLVPDPSVQALAPEDLPAVAALDAPRFGAQRQRVLAALLAAYPGRAWASRSATGEINGYLIAQRQLLGPWVATEAQAAEALLVTGLSAAFEGLVGVLVPGANAHAQDLLRAYGFKRQRRLSQMRRGSTGPLGQQAALYGLASFALG